MAYYTVDFDHKCRCGCGKRATVELKTSGTMSYGYYAKKCGEREAKRRNQHEEERRNGTNSDSMGDKSLESDPGLRARL